MSDDDIQKNLAELRAEVAALSAARRDADEQAARAAPPDGAAPGGADKKQDDSSDSEQSQLDELVELLEAEIKDHPAITCLIVFSLGILMGRFLR